MINMIPGRVDVNVHGPLRESVSFPRSDVKGNRKTNRKSYGRSNRKFIAAHQTASRLTGPLMIN